MPMIRGTASWAKIVGAPAKAYDPGKFEWSVDVSVDEATRKDLIKQGIGDKVRNKGDDRGDFLTFKRPSTRKDGTPSKPIEIVDHEGKPWPDGVKIGNGSILNVKYVINETEYGGRKFKKPGILKVQVWEHVPYEGRDGDDEEFPVKAEAKGGRKSKATSANDETFDDEIPF